MLSGKLICIFLKMTSKIKFNLGTLQGNSEWHQDCLAHLLKLLCQLGVSPNDRRQLDQFEGLGFDPYFRPRKAHMKKQANLVVPKLNKVIS